MEVEDMARVCRRGGAVPHRRRDDPGVDLDALSVRRRDERLQRIERAGDPRCERETGTQAEAVSTSYDLRDDRVRVCGPGRGDERVDLRLVVEPIAEGVGPERAELTAGRGGRRDGKLLRDRPEREAEERQDEREREEPQFPFPNA
jgi:hypothetical protein